MIVATLLCLLLSVWDHGLIPLHWEAECVVHHLLMEDLLYYSKGVNCVRALYLDICIHCASDIYRKSLDKQRAMLTCFWTLLHIFFTRHGLRSASDNCKDECRTSFFATAEVSCFKYVEWIQPLLGFLCCLCPCWGH